MDWCLPPPSHHLDRLPVRHKYRILDESQIITVFRKEGAKSKSWSNTVYNLLVFSCENRLLIFCSQLLIIAKWNPALNTRVHTRPVQQLWSPSPGLCHSHGALVSRSQDVTRINLWPWPARDRGYDVPDIDLVWGVCTLFQAHNNHFNMHVRCTCYQRKPCPFFYHSLGANNFIDNE